MRTIRFRAKTKDGGEWVEGEGYVSGYIVNKIDTVYFDDEVLSSEHKEFDCVEVVPETVGEYTGLQDVNGTSIYEGDIVRCTDKRNDTEFLAIVEFGNPNGNYDWGWQLRRIRGDKVNADILLWVEMEDVGVYIEISGDIYDGKKEGTR